MINILNNSQGSLVYCISEKHPYHGYLSVICIDAKTFLCHTFEMASTQNVNQVWDFIGAGKMYTHAHNSRQETYQLCKAHILLTNKNGTGFY